LGVEVPGSWGLRARCSCQVSDKYGLIVVRGPTQGQPIAACLKRGGIGTGEIQIHDDAFNTLMRAPASPAAFTREKAEV